MANLLLSVMGAVAEFERALIHERQLEGIALAKQRGVYKGRKRKITSELSQLIKERLAEGNKKTTIARELGVTRQSIYVALQRED